MNSFVNDWTNCYRIRLNLCWEANNNSDDHDLIDLLSFDKFKCADYRITHADPFSGNTTSMVLDLDVEFGSNNAGISDIENSLLHVFNADIKEFYTCKSVHVMYMYRFLNSEIQNKRKPEYRAHRSRHPLTERYLKSLVSSGMYYVTDDGEISKLTYNESLLGKRISYMSKEQAYLEYSPMKLEL